LYTSSGWAYLPSTLRRRIETTTAKGSAVKFRLKRKTQVAARVQSIDCKARRPFGHRGVNVQARAEGPEGTARVQARDKPQNQG
jgi:hypothetical protein